MRTERVGDISIPKGLVSTNLFPPLPPDNHPGAQISAKQLPMVTTFAIRKQSKGFLNPPWASTEGWLGLSHGTTCTNELG